MAHLREAQRSVREHESQQVNKNTSSSHSVFTALGYGKNELLVSRLTLIELITARVVMNKTIGNWRSNENKELKLQSD